MLIVREAFRRVRRFSDFRASLDVSDAILAKRLRDLVEAGVLDTASYSDHSSRVEYRLTEQGRDLWPVTVAIWAWEARWARNGQWHRQLIHDTCCRSITPVFGCGICGAVGVTHRETSAIRRPNTTFDQSNPERRYRRSSNKPSAEGGESQPNSPLLWLLGDRWSVSILGAQMLGLRRFGDIQAELGISPYLLSDRLAAFVKADVLEQVPVREGARRKEYRLLPKGLDLMPVFALTNNWGNRWYPDPDGPGLTILHHQCDSPIDPAWFCNSCGKRLERPDIHFD